ncbi:MAG: serine/threonine-protein kinase [Gordonia sp. (in: high G+C Gram-positive bacteria)]|uniref:serine/threonine-protein kinase n=1 Tax=Gordonia sp. (in: high G+C Gram-positive bacteria) TaxID=84139 RepID=UPI0039E53D9E
MAMPQPGGTFAGYEVLSLLGRGGMGSVYLVTNPNLDRREALKVLSVDSSGDFAARFSAEARTMAKLDHPGIVTVYHHGIAEAMPWFTMQYLEGSDLDRAGPLPYRDVLAIVDQAAAALDYAHTRGVVHRDIKPANILVRRDAANDDVDRVTILDFGIARLAGATSMTAAGSFVGTLSYAAPESVDGRRDIPAADQYSLACTAYTLLTGRPPFQGLTTAALMHAQLSEPPPPISRFAPSLSGLDPVFARALAKNPNGRYPSCRAFATALASGGDPHTRKQTLVAPPTSVSAASAPPQRPVPHQVTPSHPAAPNPAAPRPAAHSGAFGQASHHPVHQAPTHHLGQSQPYPMPYPAPKARSSTTTTVLAVIAILIGLAVIIGAVLLADRDESSTRGAPTTSSSTALRDRSAAPSAVAASTAKVWGFVVSPRGRVIRFKNHASKETLLGRAAEYGYTSSWGHATFTDGCGAVARGGAESDHAYFLARGRDRSTARARAEADARRATGQSGTTVSTLCVGDSFD